MTPVGSLYPSLMSVRLKPSMLQLEPTGYFTYVLAVSHNHRCTCTRMQVTFFWNATEGKTAQVKLAVHVLIIAAPVTVPIMGK